MRTLSLIAMLTAACLLGACDGSFDQREEQAETANPGNGSVGTLPNPEGSQFIRGAASIGGAVREASVILRPVNNGVVDWDDNNVLGNGVTFNNGIYQITLNDKSYRGPVLVEVRGNDQAEGGNPATSVSDRFHEMSNLHVLYAVAPFYDGYSVAEVYATPLTSAVVGRCLAFDGGVAGVQGGISMGLYGLVMQQTAEFFGLNRLIQRQPTEFADSGSFGGDDHYGYVMATLSQLAKDIGVVNVFDFYLGMYNDALDDGELNGSIGVIPNTGILMPDLGSGGLIGSALFNNFMDPANAERGAGKDNTEVSNGSGLDNLITSLDTVRDIDDAQRGYELTLRVPGTVRLNPGESFQARTTALDRIGGGIEFYAFGDAAGPGFVDFNWSSSSPANVSVQQYGLITVDANAPSGAYTVMLVIQPLPGQSFIDGPTETYSITVEVQ